MELRRLAGLDSGFVLLAGGLALLYAPLAPELVRDWNISPDFSHGFLVPGVTAWLLWLRRAELRAAPSAPFLPGVFLLGLGLAQFLLGTAASEQYLQRTSMVPFLGGWVLLVWGPARARVCAFPILFLLFMIPPPLSIWSQIALPLQLLASRFTEWLLVGVGIEIVRAGNVIHLNGLSLEVAQACSGLRSLVTLLGMSAILAEGTLLGSDRPTTWLGKGALFLAAVPVAVSVNALRVALTAIAATRAGKDVTTGFTHDMAGILMFAVSLGLLWLGRATLIWLEDKRPSSSPAS